MTMRDEARAYLEARGYKYGAGGGDAFWLMIAPNERHAFMIGRAGGLRRAKRTKRGFPRSSSVNCIRGAETPLAALNRMFGGTIAL